MYFLQHLPLFCQITENVSVYAKKGTQGVILNGPIRDEFGVLISLSFVVGFLCFFSDSNHLFLSPAFFQVDRFL